MTASKLELGLYINYPGEQNSLLLRLSDKRYGTFCSHEIHLVA